LGERPSGAEGLARRLARAMHDQRWFVGLAVLYVVLCFAVAAGVDGLAWEHIRLGYYLGLAAGIVLLLLAVRLGLACRRRRSLRPALAELRSWLTSGQVVEALPAVLVLPFFMSVYSSMLGEMPLLHAYDWDPALAMLDRRLHGVDAWRLLQPLLGHPLVTRLLDGTYAIWFFVRLSLWLAVAGGTDRALRRRHCISFVLVWALLGTVMGTAFASGGPVYYGRLVGGADPFASLMDYLHRTSASFPLWSTTLQEALWGLYVRRIEIGQGGLSAMPSLHVAVATLCALTGTRLDRWLGAALWLFVALVGLATVQLGWHYAIDAYAGALGSLAIWHAVGWASEGRHAMTAGSGPMAPDALGPLRVRQEG
jgi:hypothetical protein